MTRHPDSPSNRTLPVNELFESLEARSLLTTTFTYHDLAGLVDAGSALYVLRPGGDDGSIHTIGSAVDAVGDVDRDGFNDVLVGAGGRSEGHGEHAVAAVYSGRTGAPLYTLDDGFTEFGSSVAGIGDVNADGVPDFAVGSPRFATEGHGHSGGDELGRVYLYSGVDGTLIRTFTGENDGDRFGAAVSGAGDIDRDGTPDLLVGAPGFDGVGEDRGKAYVYSGTDGSLIVAFTGFADGDALGYSVAGAGDTDGDGWQDVIVGAPGPVQGSSDRAGGAFLFSGQSHAMIMPFGGDADGDRFGFSVDGVGDVNGDGNADVIVGAPSARNTVDGNIPSAGVARVYSGAGGGVLFTIRGQAPNINLGAAVAGAPDVDFDGRPDFIIGAPGASNESHVGVYSGANGRVLTRFSHTTSDLLGGDRLGSAVAALGDVNGDGIVDFVFGATQDANPEHSDRGRMYVFSGASAVTLLPDGLNDDRDVWGTAGAEGFLLLDGRLFILPSGSGFTSGDRVIDVNHSNTVLGGTDPQGDNAFIWVNGTRTSVSALVTSEQGGPAGTYTGYRAVDITDSGVILVERTRDGATPTAWLLDNGVLRYLFDGVPVAMNEARMVVGAGAGGALTTAVWTASGGVVPVDGLRAVDVNENGEIVGVTAGGVSTWSAGTLTPVPLLAGGSDFAPRALSNLGEIVGTYHAGSGTSGFYLRPGEGMTDIRPLVNVNAPEDFTASRDLRLAGINNNGALVGGLYDVPRGFLLDRRDGGGQFHGAVDRRVQVVTANGVTTVVAINDAGDILLFRRFPGDSDWTRSNLSDDAGVDPVTAVVIFIDPATGRPQVAGAAQAGVVVIEETASGAWVVRNLTQEIAGATPIVDSLFTLTPASGLVLVGGRNADGDVVIYGMTGTFAPNGERVWAYNNLSQSQLRAQGLSVPAFRSGLVTYVTPWDGLNVAGVDANGDIRVFWTAPGVAGWRETNLSAVAGTTPLTGDLTAYVAPWGGINVVGTDSAGHLVVTWWAPALGGNWQKNDFTAQFGGPNLRSESMTSYVTPWGGLNVGGTTDDGRVIVYWWVPDAGGQWRIDNIQAGDDARRRPAHTLTSHVAPDGTFHLVGVNQSGEVVDMRWQSGREWELEDLSGHDD
jgi:hypothetical protein